MADIKVVCGECGAENTFSEYSKEESRVCIACQTHLRTAKMSEHKKLRVRKVGRDDTNKTLHRDTGEFSGKSHSNNSVEAGMDKRLPTNKKDKAKSPSSFLLGLVVFIIFGGGLVACQYYGRTDPKIMKYYMVFRLPALALGSLAVVFDAFMEGQISGFLTLLIPPYLVYYAFARVESYWRQALFLSVVLMLGAELYFIRNDAILTHCNSFLNNQIEAVGNQLDKAGNAPVPEL
jgi:hypothetical protein